MEDNIMNNIYYDMIFKRKSFHIFKEIIPFTKQELSEIEFQIAHLTPLSNEIDVAFRIVPIEETSCKRGEYCILIYSEQKDCFLQNAGYMGEQLDLWLASKNVGVCWYGLAKPNELQYQGLDFIIMLAIGKTHEKYFRKDYTKCKRRPIGDIWDGQGSQNIIDVVKYAPSACNSQPWFIKCIENEIQIYRTRGKKGLMPLDKMPAINRLDIGIMLLFLDVYFKHNNIEVLRELFSDYPYNNEKALAEDEKIINANYILTKV